MKLLMKLNLLLLVVFGLGVGLVALEAKSFLQKQADANVLHDAGLIAASASATRNYTEQDVTPLLEKTAEHARVFLPQTIPFFAATTTFAQIRKTYPDYTYKEAALNPTNPRDRADSWESEIITYFRNAPGENELIRTHESEAGTSLYLAHPIKMESGCVPCHSQASAAPRAMLAHYGTQHGFGWKLGEVVGAQIIAVPTSVSENLAQRGFEELMLDLAFVFGATIVSIDLGLYYIVIRPLRRVSAAADRISRGEMDLESLPARGRDEVADVTRSFNRMHTSLKKAMDLLNG